MAVDTRSRRASVLGIIAPFALALPLSDGTVGQPDRQHVTFAYPGITAASISVAATLGDLTTLFDAEYLVELKVANPTRTDSLTLVRDDLSTVRTWTTYPNNDLDTIYAIYLSST